VLRALSVGAGVPGSMRAESRMVIETVTKSTTTTSVQQQQQQQQMFTQIQQQQQQVQVTQPAAVTMPAAPAAALPVDATKVSASGTGLHQSSVNQETSFIVDGSQSGLHAALSFANININICSTSVCLCSASSSLVGGRAFPVAAA